MRWEFKFEPRDCWIGLFWDNRPDGLHFFVCPLPTLCLHVWQPTTWIANREVKPADQVEKDHDLPTGSLKEKDNAGESTSRENPQTNPGIDQQGND